MLGTASLAFFLVTAAVPDAHACGNAMRHQKIPAVSQQEVAAQAEQQRRLAAQKRASVQTGLGRAGLVAGLGGLGLLGLRRRQASQQARRWAETIQAE